MSPKPSRRSLEQAFPGHGERLRELLTSAEAVRAHPAAIARERECYHPPGLHDLRMHALDAELGTYGVEYTPAGRGAKSPAIEYLNTGDTYGVTILYVNGRYRIGCWGDIVERGNYA